jgi:ArsR family transcriptional regulator, arsenate/arsenite/antimonite-responsive transcriptional repressor
MSVGRPDIGAVFRRSQGLLSALGDSSRQEIIVLLLGAPAPMAVNDIAGQVRLSQPAVSHHLRILKEAGIVTVERSGKQRLYSLAGPQPFAPLAELIAALQSCPAAADTPSITAARRPG